MHAWKLLKQACGNSKLWETWSDKRIAQAKNICPSTWKKHVMQNHFRICKPTVWTNQLLTAESLPNLYSIPQISCPQHLGNRSEAKVVLPAKFRRLETMVSPRTWKILDTLQINQNCLLKSVTYICYPYIYIYTVYTYNYNITK